MSSDISAAQIRNFSIIAHIDHGKTTLTDCFLKLTRSAGARDHVERVMDSNPIERERGITIKLAPVRMQYEYQQQSFTLNLIDTPGHVDFSYEVSRSLAACEGALLIVDATQGIQAQTLSHFEKARQLGLTIIPVVNKIDLPSADVESAVFELMELCSVAEKDIVLVSAKTGHNVARVLDAVVERIPAPSGSLTAPARALLITSQYDQHRGAVGLLRVIDGTLRKQKLHFVSTDADFMPLELGTFSPELQPSDALSVGEVGYVATGLKDIRLVSIGDTLTTALDKDLVKPLPGYQEPRPMVYMELYPVDSDEFPLLQDAMSKLALRDAALQYSGTHSLALGSGLRVGFLGILHAEIVLERLRREFNLELIATVPSVPYEVLLRDATTQIINTPGDMPDPATIQQISEPIALVTIFSPTQYMSVILDLCRDRRGEFLDSQFVGERVYLKCSLPLAELITDFHDVLKSVSSGYASLEYQLSEYRPVDAVKVTVMLNHEPVEALSFITVREQAEREGRQLVKKLVEVVPRQMFEVPIQAAIGGTVVARETLRAFRKDVTAKLYGGDVTRRQKLLKKQAKGKQRMKKFGKVELDQNTFLSVLRRS
jgi:GTP-binding protein LepA